MWVKLCLYVVLEQILFMAILLHFNIYVEYTYIGDIYMYVLYVHMHMYICISAHVCMHVYTYKAHTYMFYIRVKRA